MGMLLVCIEYFCMCVLELPKYHTQQMFQGENFHGFCEFLADRKSFPP